MVIVPFVSEKTIMALTLEAIYENRVLKPVQSLPAIQERARLWLTLHVAAETDRVRAAYGILGSMGDAESVQPVALDPEFDILESPRPSCISQISSCYAGPARYN
jgi:hypothetical protein